MDQIALRQTSLKTIDYIDIMIQEEKRDCKPGYLDRISHLENAKKNAETIEKIKAVKNFDPLIEMNLHRKKN